MNASESHLTLERIGDIVEEPETAVGEDVAHVASCDTCRDRRDRLAALLSASRSLAREVPLPEASWTTVLSAIDRGKVVALPAGAAHRRSVVPRWVGLASAAVLLVVATATVTSLWMQSHATKIAAMASLEADRVAAQPTLEPTSIVTVDRSYSPTLTELTATLAANRRLMSPKTAARVDRSLRAIDEAIAEVRDALAADPNNHVLLEILTANYRQKVDLLRRASELQPST